MEGRLLCRIPLLSWISCAPAIADVRRTGFGQSHTIWAVRKVTGRRRVDRS